MWTDEDRGYALAWQQLEDAKCPCGCGHPIDETTGPENEFAFDGRSTVCDAGRARDSEAERMAGQPGVLVYAVRDDG